MFSFISRLKSYKLSHTGIPTISLPFFGSHRYLLTWTGNLIKTKKKSSSLNLFTFVFFFMNKIRKKCLLFKVQSLKCHDQHARGRLRRWR